MVKIAPFRYLTSSSNNIPQGSGFKSAAGGFSRSPDSPRAIFELELETISPCSDIIPMPPHDSPSLASPETPTASSLVSDTPVVVLSSESFCTEHKVGLRNVQDFITSGLLREAPSKAFFIYSQTSGSHTQIGVCAALSVDDYEKGIVKKHENTIFDKEETEACNLFFENV